MWWREAAASSEKSREPSSDPSPLQKKSLKATGGRSANPVVFRAQVKATVAGEREKTNLATPGGRMGNHPATAAAAKSLQSCPTLCDPRYGSSPGWDSPGKNTGVGCHFLLQCMKVKSESEVAQSFPTPSDPMDCSLPGSSVHGIFQARVLEWGAIAFSGKSS